jgi:hypothetical protein
MKILSFNKWNLNENITSSKYPHIKINLGDDTGSQLRDEESKLDIIEKYFPFDHVYGVIEYESGLVDLNFDNFSIKGNYDSTSETLPCKFDIEGLNYDFNYHTHGSMGRTDLIDFEKEIKRIHDNETSFTLCLGEEQEAIICLGNFKNEKEAFIKLNNIGFYLVKGIQIEGKQLGKTIANNSTDVKKLK